MAGTAEGKADVVRRMHQAVNDRDRERVLSFLTEDVVWHVSGDNPLAGTLRGREELWERFGAPMFETPARIHDREVIAHGDFVVAFYEVENDFGDGMQTFTEVEVFRLDADGRIAERWEFVSGQEDVDRQLTRAFGEGG